VAATVTEVARRVGVLRGELERGSAWLFVLVAWAGSRVFFLVAGGLAHRLLDPAIPGGSPREPPGVLNEWAHWDGGWYCAIATHGYFSPPSTSFFPLYPLLIRFADVAPGGTAFWGVTVSIACLLATLYFLYRIAEELFDVRAARAATLAFAFFPSAFFMNAVYSEALFLALTTGTVWALRVRRSFLLACLFAYFAMLARNVGIVLLVPLVFEFVRGRRAGERPSALGLVASVGGLLAYMLYLWKWLGSPLYFAVAQRETWGRAFTNPIDTLHKAWTTGVFGARYAFHPHAIFGNDGAEPAFKAADTFNLILFGLFVLLVLLAIRRLPLDLWLYSVLVMALPILTPSPLWALTSFNRYLLAAFPLFVVLGWALSRSSVALGVWLGASAAAGIYLTALFTTWRWVA
jgi:Mannosyltransferase (PIG-V)